MPPREGLMVSAFTTIELDNLLVMALKQYLKSSLLQCRTISKKRVVCAKPAANPSIAAAMILSILNTGKYKSLKNPMSISGRDEQTFREPRDALRVLGVFGASNTASLMTAMAYNGNIFSEIATVRNFFAHRSENTSEKVRKLSNSIGLIGFTNAETFLTRRRPLTHLTIMEGWMNDLDTFFREALL
jgi:hypothetical protein